MSDPEIEALLALEVPARVATLDRDGFPHVTPLWFVWSGGAFYMTSLYDRPHLNRLRRNSRAGRERLIPRRSLNVLASAVSSSGPIPC